MYVLYVVMGIFCLVSGINNLFYGDGSLAVHYFLLLLFCHMIVFEFLKKPFEQKIYLLAAPLLMLDGIYQLFIGKEIFAGIIGLFFGFSLWQSRHRVKR